VAAERTERAAPRPRRPAVHVRRGARPPARRARPARSPPSPPARRRAAGRGARGSLPPRPATGAAAPRRPSATPLNSTPPGPPARPHRGRGPRDRAARPRRGPGRARANSPRCGSEQRPLPRDSVRQLRRRPRDAIRPSASSSTALASAASTCRANADARCPAPARTEPDAVAHAIGIHSSSPAARRKHRGDRMMSGVVRCAARTRRLGGAIFTRPAPERCAPFRRRRCAPAMPSALRPPPAPCRALPCASLPRTAAGPRSARVADHCGHDGRRGTPSPRRRRSRNVRLEQWPRRNRERHGRRGAHARRVHPAGGEVEACGPSTATTGPEPHQAVHRLRSLALRRPEAPVPRSASTARPTAPQWSSRPTRRTPWRRARSRFAVLSEERSPGKGDGGDADAEGGEGARPRPPVPALFPRRSRRARPSQRALVLARDDGGERAAGGVHHTRPGSPPRRARGGPTRRLRPRPGRDDAHGFKGNARYKGRQRMRGKDTDTGQGEPGTARVSPAADSRIPRQHSMLDAVCRATACSEVRARLRRDALTARYEAGGQTMSNYTMQLKN